MFPSKQDYAYWSAHKAPQWAGPIEPPSIHAVINSHCDDTRRRDRALHHTLNDVSLLQRMRINDRNRAGPPLRARMRDVVDAPGCGHEKRRRSNFRKWLNHITNMPVGRFYYELIG